MRSGLAGRRRRICHDCDASIDSMACRASTAVMATLTIRQLPDPVRDAIRVAAAHNGRSMEAEVRDALMRVYGPSRSGGQHDKLDRARAVLARGGAGADLVADLMARRDRDG